MGSSLITGSGSTSSGGVLYSSSTTQEVPQESSITLENEILYTGVPIMSSTSSVDQTGVTLYTTPVVASSGEETISIPTLLQKHHRDYYKGISFRYSPEWKENYHYRNDEYIVDFISITPTTLLYCKQSHLSTVRPVLTYDSEGNVVGIDSEDWGISITVRDGRTLTWDDYTEEQKQDLIDDVLQNFNYSAIYVGEHRSNEDNDNPTLFPASEIEYAQLNDVYISTLTWGLYVCVYPGDPETAKWVYKGKIKGDTGEKGDTGDMGKRGPKGDKGDKGNSWFTGTSLTGEDYIDITISGARKGDLYLNVETGKIYQCIRDEFDGGVIETVLLDETFEQLGANETLETYNYYGTTVYEGDPITYEQSSPGTKGMNEALSGGEAPELLLARNSTLTILDVPTAGGSEIELSILSNNYGRLLIPDTDQYAVTTIEDGRYLLTLKEPLNYIDVVIENHVNSNVRIDDIHLKITEPGSSTPQKWIYTSTIDWTAGLSGKINTVPTATSGNISVFTNNGNLEDSGVSIDDIAVQNDLSNFITKSVNDLTNYYLKSETYTKDEVAALIGAIQQFHYEVYPSTNSITDPESNVLYLIGPTGTGSDKYEEYVYDSTKQDPFVKIGDTSIDLSDYVTTSILNTALSAYTTTADLTTLLAAKYEKPPTGIPESDLSSAVTSKLNATEIFWAEYGVTTAAEIDAALDAGKMVIAKDSNRQLPFMYEVDTHIYFGSIVDTASYFFRLTKSNNAWVVGVSSLEKIANRVNDITGNESSDTYYPSTKAVADYVASKTEVFVAEYGVTTASELDTAIAAGKTLFVVDGTVTAAFGDKIGNSYYFSSIAGSTLYRRVLNNGTWQRTAITIENAGSRVSSFQATPDNSHYPSEKLVKDSLDAKANKVSSPTEGDLAKLDANGNLADSGLTPNMLSLFPDFDNLSPLQTIEYDVNTSGHWTLFERDNSAGTLASDATETIACRLTTTGTNLAEPQIVDLVAFLPGQVNIPFTVLVNAKTPNTTAANRYGIYQMQEMYPKAIGSGYGWGVRMNAQASASVTRHIKIEVFKTADSIAFSTSKVDTYNSTYHNVTGGKQLYGGIRSIAALYADINGTSTASAYLNGYLTSFIPGTPAVVGEAIAYQNICFFSTDNKLYKVSTTNLPIFSDAGIHLVGNSYSVDQTVGYAYLRQKASCTIALSSTIFDTFAKGEEIYLRCHLSNGALYSDGVLTNAVVPGYTWISVGKADSATTLALDTVGKQFFTLDANGKLTHINGREIAGGSTADAVTNVTVGGVSVVNDGVAEIPTIPELEALSYNEIDAIIEEVE